MAASYSTLNPKERTLAGIPVGIQSVLVLRSEGSIEARVSALSGDRVLTARQIGNNCFDVAVEDYPHTGGQRKRCGAVVEFTTTGDFIEQWIEMANSEVRK